MKYRCCCWHSSDGTWRIMETGLESWRHSRGWRIGLVTYCNYNNSLRLSIRVKRAIRWNTWNRWNLADNNGNKLPLLPLLLVWHGNRVRARSFPSIPAMRAAKWWTPGDELHTLWDPAPLVMRKTCFGHFGNGSIMIHPNAKIVR